MSGNGNETEVETCKCMRLDETPLKLSELARGEVQLSLDTVAEKSETKVLIKTFKSE